MKFETRYVRPQQVIAEKKLKRSDFKTLYSAVTSVIQRFCELNHMYADVVFKYKIETDYGAIYGDTEYAMFDSDNFNWEYMNDFDEGEDFITITDICYLHEIFENDQE